MWRRSGPRANLQPASEKDSKPLCRNRLFPLECMHRNKVKNHSLCSRLVEIDVPVARVGVIW